MNYGIHSEFINKTGLFLHRHHLWHLWQSPSTKKANRADFKKNPMGNFLYCWIAKLPFSDDWPIFGENGCRECGGRNCAGRISSKSCFVFSPFLVRICKLRPPLTRVKRKWFTWHTRKCDKQAKLIKGLRMGGIYLALILEYFHETAAAFCLWVKLCFKNIRLLNL